MPSRTPPSGLTAEAPGPLRPARVLLVYLAIGAAGAGILFLHLHSEYHRHLAIWDARQSSVAGDRARLVSNWLRERRLDAEANSRAPEVIAYLSRRAAPSAAAVPAEDLLSHLALLNQTKDSYGYLGTYVLDTRAG